ncbi:MAG TPA: bifunctional oligoribonuclease/PAP phosphatase NrnA [Candidatus Saccharicenans sp.]|jgi:phosphoesterase RecJ-like protein|nr:bifunctional oligoribonuclease/PAP phosphatase NrnA [Candidatus Saccharicenans sp.]HRD02403.1 bifunctional oligoribonuclease/PAP phosphatase NrnA [Candidatus Saccharicenans sp.]
MSQSVKVDIARKIIESTNIAITIHLRPDGDAIYTSLALAAMLDLLGKKVQVVSHDPLPFPFVEFPETKRIKIGEIEPEGLDLVILLECADVPRSGQTKIDQLPKINIDHHYSNSPFGDLNWIDPQASAVGEMIYWLIKPLGIKITPEIATYLYSAIFSDTGSFQFSNTSGQTLYVCHQLVEAGASPHAVAEKLLNNNSPSKIRLLGRILSTLQLNKAGNIAIITMLIRDREEFGFKEVDIEDATTLARSIKGVEMVIFFKEISPGKFRVSLRSKGRANSALVAEKFGGGGHVNASGFTVYGQLEELYDQIPAEIERIILNDKTKLST